MAIWSKDQRTKGPIAAGGGAKGPTARRRRVVKGSKEQSPPEAAPKDHPPAAGGCQRIKGTDAAGGGGSNFIPAFDRLDEERNDSVVIAFTDGYINVPATMPESLKGVVWVLTQGGCDPTKGKWGHVLRLDGDDNGEWE